MVLVLLRSAGGLQRLAQASAASTLIASDLSQPASFTSLLAWHSQSTTGHGKRFSSDDKQGRPHEAAEEQVPAPKQAASDKSQGTSNWKGKRTCEFQKELLCGLTSYFMEQIMCQQLSRKIL